MAKKSGDKMPPCFVPQRTLKESERDFPHLQCTSYLSTNKWQLVEKQQKHRSPSNWNILHKFSMSKLRDWLNALVWLLVIDGWYTPPRHWQGSWIWQRHSGGVFMMAGLHTTKLRIIFQSQLYFPDCYQPNPLNPPDKWFRVSTCVSTL